MRTTITPLALLLTCLPLAGLGCGNQGSGSTGAAVAESAQAMASAAPTTPPPTVPAASSAAAAPSPGASAAAEPASSAVAPAASSAAAGTPAPPASASASAAPSGSAAAGAKKFDCGAKGQKACPMQGWMKSVMGSAASSGDGEKLAKALAYTAGKPPPGMGQWTAISNDGVAKAKAGDIEGAKVSCKKCHDLYKESYKRNMRDLPW